MCDKSIKLGSQHGGGTVFWLNEDGTNGLIMANEDQTRGGVDWNKAMELAKNYRDPDGHDDWRLPNKDELNEMYEYCKANKELNGEVYWSSSEYSGSANYNAWGQDFSGGYQYNYNKIGFYFGVRAVRSFNIKINTGEKMTDTNSLLSTKEIAKKFGMSVSWFGIKSRYGDMPHVKIKGDLFYEPSKIYEYIKMHSAEHDLPEKYNPKESYIKQRFAAHRFNLSIYILNTYIGLGNGLPFFRFDKRSLLYAKRPLKEFANKYHAGLIDNDAVSPCSKRKSINYWKRLPKTIKKHRDTTLASLNAANASVEKCAESSPANSEAGAREPSFYDLYSQLQTITTKLNGLDVVLKPKDNIFVRIAKALRLQ